MLVRRQRFSVLQTVGKVKPSYLEMSNKNFLIFFLKIIKKEGRSRLVTELRAIYLRWLEKDLVKVSERLEKEVVKVTKQIEKDLVKVSENMLKKISGGT